MTTTFEEDPKPDGAAFDDFFESLGKKAEDLNNTEQKSDSNGTASQARPDEEEEQKVVDEIESLCMNCHENVFFSVQYTINTANIPRASPVYCSLEYPSFAKLYSCLSTVHTAISSIPKSNPPERYSRKDLATNYDLHLKLTLPAKLSNPTHVW